MKEGSVETDVRRTDRSPPLAAGVLAAVLLLALGASGCGGGAGESASYADREASGVQFATANFRVDGMTCGGCALATEIAVKKVDGVESVDAEYDEATGEGWCTVRYRPDRTGPDRLAAAIRQAGFDPHLRTVDDP